ncbi:MAG: hypothetical protein FIA98_15560 [Anaerolineae bacterium]|nr:hypothetical protein [Anaerolineae bacterium]
MSDITPTPEFEEEIRASVSTPMAREEFLKDLHARILHEAEIKPRTNRPVYLRPACVAVFIITVLLIGFLAIGPQRVIAAVRGLLGYIPGVGIVEQGSPIRVLAEPVTVTRNEISIKVTSATLSADKTHIEYRIFGVPGSAYPDREDIMGCTKPEYLRLPDGTQLARKGNDFEPIPDGVNAATFVMPCIFNTLPGKTPDNWELSLRFITAPPDLIVMPVIDLVPSPQASLIPETTAVPEASGATPTSGVNNQITIIKEIETSEGYILVGQFPFQGPPGEQVERGDAEIRDETGKEVAFAHPQDVSPNSLGLDPNGPYWFMQFKAAGLVYPLNLSFSGFTIQQADPNATAEFTFDAGSNPQPGQEWTPNQDIQLAGHTLRLLSITADSRNGYRFSFQGDPNVISADIQISGYTSTGHGWGRGLTDGGFSTSLSFTQFPTGVLTVTLSNLTIIGDPISWQGQWSPTSLRTDLPAIPTPHPCLCASVDTLEQLNPAPAELTHGKALFYEKLEDTGTWGLVLYNLDSSQKQVVTLRGNWGALSPDGKEVAYSGLDNAIHIFDVDTQTDQILQYAYGFDIHWSPDARQIAFVYLNGSIIDSVFIMNADGTDLRQVSELSYESVVGWSPDGTLVYFVAPYTGGAAWKVYSFELASGVIHELFTIENGTPKFLNPTLSPDGKWIAYRGLDNSSLYLVRTDGSDMHLVLDNVDVVEIEWSSNGWLAANLQDLQAIESTIVLVKPDNCEIYKLPFTLQGNLEGMFFP